MTHTHTHAHTHVTLFLSPGTACNYRNTPVTCAPVMCACRAGALTYVCVCVCVKLTQNVPGAPLPVIVPSGPNSNVLLLLAVIGLPFPFELIAELSSSWYSDGGMIRVTSLSCNNGLDLCTHTHTHTHTVTYTSVVRVSSQVTTHKHWNKQANMD